jgi:hypothetical protein
MLECKMMNLAASANIDESNIGITSKTLKHLETLGLTSRYITVSREIPLEMQARTEDILETFQTMSFSPISKVSNLEEASWHTLLSYD